MIQFVCFSRQRPLQLHGYLSSLFAHWTHGEITVDVLVKLDEGYGAAYLEVQRDFPTVRFWPETTFATNLQAIIQRSTADLLSFGCDDVVFIEPVSPSAISNAFEDDPQLLGLSLRLGRNITQDMFGQPMQQPEFLPAPGTWCLWNVGHPLSQVDWAYPWEVLGTIYPIGFVREMLAAFEFGSPSQLEERGTRLWAQHTLRRRMAAWPTSRIVVPTPNVIQTEFSGNGIRGRTPLSPEFLLSCWQNGLRMHTSAFDYMETLSWRIPEFFLRREQ